MWTEASTVRDGVAARAVSRRPRVTNEETRVVRVTRFLADAVADGAGDFCPPEHHEPSAPRALLDV
jgi:hypothetical protein